MSVALDDSQTGVIGSERRGWNSNAAPVLMRVTATSSKTGAGSALSMILAVHSEVDPTTSTSSRSSTPRTTAWRGRRDSGPQSAIQAPSSYAFEAFTATEDSVNVALT